MSASGTIQPVVRNAEFWKGAPSIEVATTDGLFEVALVGRSNVGKSTLINRLCNKRKLARTSGTPGSTQQLVLYRVEVETGHGDTEVLPVCLVDLPGFGFAKRSKRVKRGLDRLIADYVQNQPTLQVLCVLNDARRDPEQEELELCEIAQARDIALLIVLTKLDKLGHSERLKRIAQISKLYGLSASDLILSGEKESVEAFWSRLMLLGAARAA